jgi:hypothetical protein
MRTPTQSCFEDINYMRMSTKNYFEYINGMGTPTQKCWLPINGMGILIQKLLGMVQRYGDGYPKIVLERSTVR